MVLERKGCSRISTTKVNQSLQPRITRESLKKAQDSPCFSSDAERVLRLIDAVIDRVPDSIRTEVDRLRGILRSPIFYRYLNHKDMEKFTTVQVLSSVF